MEKTENPIVLGVLDALGITKERRLFHTDRSAFSADRLYIPAVHIYDTQVRNLVAWRPTAPKDPASAPDQLRAGLVTMPVSCKPLHEMGT